MHIQSATPGANDAPICICGGGNLQEEVICVECIFLGVTFTDMQKHNYEQQNIFCNLHQNGQN